MTHRSTPKLTGKNRASIDAYYAMIMGPKLGQQQEAIVKFLAHNAHRDYTRAELAKYTGMRLSSVCGRVNELVEAQAIVEGERRPCLTTGVSAHTLRLAPAQLEITL